MSHMDFKAIKDDPVGYHVRINEDIISLVKETGNKRWFDTVRYIKITEYDPDNKVITVQVWCRHIIDVIRNKYRYNVFYMNILEETWFVIEGDLGRARDYE